MKPNSPSSSPVASVGSADSSSITQDSAQKDKITGNKSLIILGLVSVGIAVITTAISLVIYHNSGDIYLDRSRPGYLPDKSETQTSTDSSYDFSVNGPLTREDLDEYTKHFQEELDAIDDLKDPFSETPLSDDSLGIPKAPPVEDEAPAESEF